MLKVKKYNDKMIEKNYKKILKLIRVELPEEEQGKYRDKSLIVRGKMNI
mgnify:CR=1 FL=1